ncbi:MAG: ATP-binding protein [Pseudomonadota bacterium]
MKESEPPLPLSSPSGSAVPSGSAAPSGDASLADSSPSASNGRTSGRQHASARPARRWRFWPRFRLGLQAKVVVGLLLLAAVPVVVSAIFVGEISVVAQNVADGEIERLQSPLQNASEAYRDAIAARKESFRRSALAMARDPRLRDLCLRASSRNALEHALRAALLLEPMLMRATIEVDGVEAAVAERPPVTADPQKTLTLDQQLAEAPSCKLSLTYATSARLLGNYERLGAVLKAGRDRRQIHRALPAVYELSFLLVVGGFMAATAAVAIVFARRTTRRISTLVAATQHVGEGKLDTGTVEARGRDELADLARAFNKMVADIKRSRAEIEYLHKIGAWQEVARRLAHEIKNPLTPIQLAVQQLYSKYPGGDEKYRRLLDDSLAIVTEEVAGLKRLVDAFRVLATLPKVEPKALDFGAVVSDVARETEIEVGGGSTQPALISGDRLLLRRALVNLVENARQAGATRVRIDWWASGTTLNATVEDNGTGVAEELRERVFDPYFTTKEQGTGLGLAIVKKTLLEHRGEIILAPEKSVLGGARFEIRLPVV